MNALVVCIGNRYVASDSLGPRVHDALVARALPEGVRAIDGGLAGLDLLATIERARRVVFVDALAGEGEGDEVVALEASDLDDAPIEYGHDAGLAYLLRVLPRVCDGAPPSCAVVGAIVIDGAAPSESLVERVADRALALARIEAGGGS